MKSRFEKSGGGGGSVGAIFSEFVVFCGRFSIISAVVHVTKLDLMVVCVCAGAVKP